MIFVLQGEALYKQMLGNEGSVEAVLPTSNISLPITLQNSCYAGTGLLEVQAAFVWQTADIHAEKQDHQTFALVNICTLAVGG